jgi:hypothetical protein
MSAAGDCELIGRWRIVEADLWDRDYLDLVEPAYMAFAKNGRGEFAFGVVNATMELGYGQRIVFFMDRFRRRRRDPRLRLSRTRRQWHD